MTPRPRDRARAGGRGRRRRRARGARGAPPRDGVPPGVELVRAAEDSALVDAARDPRPRSCWSTPSSAARPGEVLELAPDEARRAATSVRSRRTGSASPRRSRSRERSRPTPSRPSIRIVGITIARPARYVQALSPAVAAAVPRGGRARARAGGALTDARGGAGPAVSSRRCSRTAGRRARVRVVRGWVAETEALSRGEPRVPLRRARARHGGRGRAARARAACRSRRAAAAAARTYAPEHHVLALSRLRQRRRRSSSARRASASTRSRSTRRDPASRSRVEGVVQGVGFRPFVHGAATARGLAGWVRNRRDGLRLEVEGPPSAVRDFVTALATRAAAGGAGRRASTWPRWRRSESGLASASCRARPAAAARPTLPADLATCAECLAEIGLAGARRYRYPFTNCTRCGPRYTIIEALPYDRARTAMRRFPAVRGVRGGVRRPDRPPLPRRADRLSRVRTGAPARSPPTASSGDARRRRARRGASPALAAGGSSR